MQRHIETKSVVANTVRLLTVGALSVTMIRALIPQYDAQAAELERQLHSLMSKHRFQQEDPPPGEEEDTTSTVVEVGRNDLTTEELISIQQAVGHDVESTLQVVTVANAIMEHVKQRNLVDGCPAHGSTAQSVLELATSNFEEFKKLVMRIAVATLEDGVVAAVYALVQTAEGKTVVLVVNNPDLRSRQDAFLGTTYRTSATKFDGIMRRDGDFFTMQESPNAASPVDSTHHFDLMKKFLNSNVPCQNGQNGPGGGPGLVPVPGADALDQDMQKDGVDLSDVSVDEHEFPLSNEATAASLAVPIVILGGMSLTLMFMLFGRRSQSADYSSGD